MIIGTLIIINVKATKFTILKMPITTYSWNKAEIAKVTIILMNNKKGILPNKPTL